MKSIVYKKLSEFKRRYPLTIAWRTKAHSGIVEKYLNPGEIVQYVFAAQKNASSFDFFCTYIVVLTNKRILLGQKRLIFGYFYTAITPDMFNDITISSGIIWGKVNIDTINELVQLSNVDKRALAEIETCITEYMIREKKKYGAKLSNK